MRMKALLVVGSIVAALAAAGAAGAAGENGAVVVDYSICSPTPVFLVCSAAKTVTNVTSTSSGNLSYVTNGVIEVSYTNPFCSISQTQPFHLHYLEQEGELQSRSQRLSLTNQLSCAGVSHICVTTLDAHYANGDVRFSRSETVCTTP